MKFGKEFCAQMVSEWQEAYMNYNYLKSLLKELKRFKKRNEEDQEITAPCSSLKRKLTLYRAFSGLTQRHGDTESQAIIVDDDSREEDQIRAQNYQATVLMAADEAAEIEFGYLGGIEDEFYKVEKFYRGKVEEVMKEAEMLNKQMDALIAFRVKVENPEGLEFDLMMTRLASGVAASAAALSASTPLRAISCKRPHVTMETIEEDDESKFGQSEEASEDEDDKETQLREEDFDETKPYNHKAVRPPPLEVLNRVKMNNSPRTPRSTIMGFLNISTHTQLHFSKENLNKVEQQLKQAFVDFYQKLKLLKSFSFLNTLAFSKIMKKYDKITSKNASKDYMKMVDSYLTSEEVTKLMERVENAFIKHFCNANRTKGMNILSPPAKIQRHRTTFFMGFLAGGSAALLASLILLVHARNIMHKPGSTKYMETMFPLYSLFGFVVLHMVMFALTMYFWKRYRVNYPFIFGFKYEDELGYRQVLLSAFGLAVLGLLAVLANLDMEMDPTTKDYEATTELLPLFVVLLVVVILICPFNIIYRSSRFFFLNSLFRGICAPLYKVLLPDFFLADQLTSQVQALRSLIFYFCYYGWGDYRKRENTCKANTVFQTFSLIVAIIPYWARLCQCARRLYEEEDHMHAMNGLKYTFAIAAICFRTGYSLNKEVWFWYVFAWVFSVIAAVFGTYWDLVVDWGLLQRSSRNPWLRDKLLIPQKSVYFIAMGLNTLLRLAWVQTVLNISVSYVHREGLVAIVATLEIIRRGMWSFFRLENEHLNNVGKFRAFKSVPLPFSYDEDEKDS